MAGEPTTVVSGLPRSGTSLVMQMLAAGGLPVFTDAVRPADADNPRGYFEHSQVKRLARDASVLEGAAGCVVKVVAPLVRSLPEGGRYRVLFLERDLDEVLASQAAMIERTARGPTEADLASVRFAMQRASEQSRDALARRSDVALRVVAHAALLADPALVAEEMGGFLGGGLQVAAMAAVVDASLHRQHRAIRAS